MYFSDKEHQILPTAFSVDDEQMSSQFGMPPEDNIAPQETFSLKL